MARYAVIDDQNEVVNVIEWDGVSNWMPPAGHVVIPHEQCARGDIWMEEIEDFVRPLKVMYAPEDETSLAERSAIFEQAKAKFKTGMTFIDHTGAHSA
jgi:hypothetical protein